MKENNWEQVKNIFQAALERPPVEREQFLAEACRGDRLLSDEIRELLESFEENDSFFEQAAIGEVAEFIINPDEKLKAGEQLGRYRIKSVLGAGGMGEVFLAEDTELERLVALKILSSVFSSDGDRLRRFVQEAKSASALNHPNILTIYEIGRFDDLHFIATEYVKGETLRQQQKTLQLSEILDIAGQVALALNAAHEARIVHRDIKPENIMIREDGLVKILDFGLAKLISQTREAFSPETPPRQEFNTAPGLIMGTVAYMSPEQARGKPTDARTDIWSLGVCLYEMIAGFKPFAGDTTSDTIASILRNDPLPLPPAAPPELNRIVQKALQKKRENRYPTVKDLLFDLKHLQQLPGGAAGHRTDDGKVISGFQETAVTDDDAIERSTNFNYSDTAPNVNAGGRTRLTGTVLIAATAAILFLTAVGTGLYYFTPVFRQLESFQTMRFGKLTYTGNVAGELGSISPDGKYTVYVVQEAGGEQSLHVSQIAASGSLQIVPPAKVEYVGVTFSLDSNYVYYSLTENKRSTTLYRIPVLGGEARKLMDNVGSPVTFSPDGQQMALVRDERFLMIAKSDGTEVRQLAVAGEGRRWSLPVWSPDGKIIVSSVFSSADNNHYLVEVGVEDGVEKPLNSPPWMRLSGLAWLPDKSGLILTGRDFETKLSQIWLVTYPEGRLKKITNDLNTYTGVSLTADGQKIASIQYERVSNVWLASDAGELRQITFGKDKDKGMSGVALAPDGKIIYTARIAGIQDLWITNQDGTGQRQLTQKARTSFSPAVSPDNRYIVFISDRSGSTNIWRMDLDGGNPKQLTDVKGLPGVPAFSPDGQWVIYQFNDAENRPTIWKVNIEGGPLVQLTDFYSGKPVISPNGEVFACLYAESAETPQRKIAIVPFSGGAPAKILDWPLVVKSPLFRWATDGRGLIYAENRGQVYNLWNQPLDNSPPKQLTDFKSEEIFRFDVIGSQPQFLVSRGQESSDIITIDNFR